MDDNTTETITTPKVMTRSQSRLSLLNSAGSTKHQSSPQSETVTPAIRRSRRHSDQSISSTLPKTEDSVLERFGGIRSCRLPKLINITEDSSHLAGNQSAHDDTAIEKTTPNSTRKSRKRCSSETRSEPVQSYSCKKVLKIETTIDEESKDANEKSDSSAENVNASEVKLIKDIEDRILASFKSSLSIIKNYKSFQISEASRTDINNDINNEISTKLKSFTDQVQHNSIEKNPSTLGKILDEYCVKKSNESEQKIVSNELPKIINQIDSPNRDNSVKVISNGTSTLNQNPEKTSTSNIKSDQGISSCTKSKLPNEEKEIESDLENKPTLTGVEVENTLITPRKKNSVDFLQSASCTKPKLEEKISGSDPKNEFTTKASPNKATKKNANAKSIDIKQQECGNSNTISEGEESLKNIQPSPKIRRILTRSQMVASMEISQTSAKTKQESINTERVDDILKTSDASTDITASKTADDSTTKIVKLDMKSREKISEQKKDPKEISECGDAGGKDCLLKEKSCNEDSNKILNVSDSLKDIQSPLKALRKSTRLNKVVSNEILDSTEQNKQQPTNVETALPQTNEESREEPTVAEGATSDDNVKKITQPDLNSPTITIEKSRNNEILIESKVSASNDELPKDDKTSDKTSKTKDSFKEDNQSSPIVRRRSTRLHEVASSKIPNSSEKQKQNAIDKEIEGLATINEESQVESKITESETVDENTEKLTQFVLTSPKSATEKLRSNKTPIANKKCVVGSNELVTDEKSCNIVSDKISETKDSVKDIQSSPRIRRKSIRLHQVVSPKVPDVLDKKKEESIGSEKDKDLVTINEKSKLIDECETSDDKITKISPLNLISQKLKSEALRTQKHQKDIEFSVDDIALQRGENISDMISKIKDLHSCQSSPTKRRQSTRIHKVASTEIPDSPQKNQQESISMETDGLLKINDQSNINECETYDDFNTKNTQLDVHSSGLELEELNNMSKEFNQAGSNVLQHEENPSSPGKTFKTNDSVQDLKSVQNTCRKSSRIHQLASTKISDKPEINTQKSSSSNMEKVEVISIANISILDEKSESSKSFITIANTENSAISPRRDNDREATKVLSTQNVLETALDRKEDNIIDNSQKYDPDQLSLELQGQSTARRLRNSLRETSSESSSEDSKSMEELDNLKKTKVKIVPSPITRAKSVEKQTKLPIREKSLYDDLLIAPMNKKAEGIFSPKTHSMCSRIDKTPTQQENSGHKNVAQDEKSFVEDTFLSKNHDLSNQTVAKLSLPIGGEKQTGEDQDNIIVVLDESDSEDDSSSLVSKKYLRKSVVSNEGESLKDGTQIKKTERRWRKSILSGIKDQSAVDRSPIKVIQRRFRKFLQPNDGYKSVDGSPIQKTKRHTKKLIQSNAEDETVEDGRPIQKSTRFQKKFILSDEEDGMVGDRSPIQKTKSCSRESLLSNEEDEAAEGDGSPNKKNKRRSRKSTLSNVEEVIADGSPIQNIRPCSRESVLSNEDNVVEDGRSVNKGKRPSRKSKISNEEERSPNEITKRCSRKSILSNEEDEVVKDGSPIEKTQSCSRESVVSNEDESPIHKTKRWSKKSKLFDEEDEIVDGGSWIKNTKRYSRKSMLLNEQVTVVEGESSIRKNKRSARKSILSKEANESSDEDIPAQQISSSLRKSILSNYDYEILNKRPIHKPKPTLKKSILSNEEDERSEDDSPIQVIHLSSNESILSNEEEESPIQKLNLDLHNTVPLNDDEPLSSSSENQFEQNNSKRFDFRLGNKRKRSMSPKFSSCSDNSSDESLANSSRIEQRNASDLPEKENLHRKFDSKNRANNSNNSLDDLQLTPNEPTVRPEKPNITSKSAHDDATDNDTADSAEPSDVSSYLYDEAEECSGTDTPSDGSNDIIEIGEDVGSSSSGDESSDSYASDNFIVKDDIEPELLSGTGDDLSSAHSSEDSDVELLSFDKKSKKLFNRKKRMKSRIIIPSDSSSSDCSPSRKPEVISTLPGSKKHVEIEKKVNISIERSPTAGNLGKEQVDLKSSDQNNVETLGENATLNQTPIQEEESNNLRSEDDSDSSAYESPDLKSNGWTISTIPEKLRATPSQTDANIQYLPSDVINALDTRPSTVQPSKKKRKRKKKKSSEPQNFSVVSFDNQSNFSFNQSKAANFKRDMLFGNRSRRESSSRMLKKKLKIGL